MRAGNGDGGGRARDARESAREQASVAMAMAGERKARVNDHAVRDLIPGSIEKSQWQ